MNSYGGAAIRVMGAVLLTLASNCVLAADKSPCDLKTGQKIFSKCAACHTHDASGNHGAGPNLYGIVNRLSGAAEGFPYSSALLESERKWSVEALDKFLEKPGRIIPGTSMAFAGIRKPHQREAVICYLQKGE